MSYLSAAGAVLIWVIYGAAGALDASVGVDGQHQYGMTALLDRKWIHGSADCALNPDPPIEVFRYDQSSYILRQNKCLSFEAPFIYVLIGQRKALVLDTGATLSAEEFPLYETVEKLVENHPQSDESSRKPILVVHSHSHGDHHAGDSQFEGKPHVMVVEPDSASIAEFFAFGDGPDPEAFVELGARTLTVVHTPGHQEESVSIYDPQTKWLLTGDTVYPGYIYVKNWNDYVESIGRLVSLSRAYEVSAVLGAHIEMTDEAGEFYPVGTIYQPNEASLVLTPEDLAELSSMIRQDDPQKVVLERLVVAPMNPVQKLISNLARWILQ